MKNVWNIVWCAAVALTLSGCTKEIIEKRGDGTTGSGKTFPATLRVLRAGNEPCERSRPHPDKQPEQIST